MHLLSLKNAFRARLPSKLHRQLLHHRQLIHQHHLQPHLQCGNDPTVANHNGILSTAHARKTVETPFTMRNRSEHDPNMIRPHTRPSLEGHSSMFVGTWLLTYTKISRSDYRVFSRPNGCSAWSGWESHNFHVHFPV